MKRLVWGIVLAVFGALCLASSGQNPQGPAGSILIGLLCLAGGGVLMYVGWGYLKAKEKAGNIALAMLRDEGRLDGREMAFRLGTSETKARMLVADLQRNGVIPFKAEVV